MANVAANIRVGSPKIGGYAFVAPIGSTKPTDASTALGQDYEGMGYVSNEGLTLATEKSTEAITDWNLDEVLTIDGEKSVTLTVRFLETVNPVVLREFYGEDNVTSTGSVATAWAWDGEALPHRQWSFELNLGGDDGRLVINDGQITNMDNLVLAKNQVIGHQATIRAYRDSDGKFFRMYRDEADAA